MRRKFFGREIGESEIADFAAGLGFFQEFQSRAFIELGEIILSPFIEASFCVWTE